MDITADFVVQPSVAQHCTFVSLWVLSRSPARLLVPPQISHHGSPLRFFSWQIPTHLVAGLRILCLHKCLPDPQTQVVFLPVGAMGTGAVASEAAVAHSPCRYGHNRRFRGAALSCSAIYQSMWILSGWPARLLVPPPSASPHGPTLRFYSWQIPTLSLV